MQAFVKVLMICCVIGSFLLSCKRGPDAPDVSNIAVNIKSRMFFMDLFDGESQDIDGKASQLKASYGDYLEAYSQMIIDIGSSNDPLFSGRLKSFVDYVNQQGIYEKCKEEYGNVDDIISGLEQAYRYCKYYFPQVRVPEVYFHISGFNQSIALDSAWVSVSVDKYLGEDYEAYELLAIPVYLRKRMVRAKIVPDVMKAIVMTSFPAGMNKYDVISSMIEKAKVLYFVHHMVPDIKEHLLFDLSKDELHWCKKYESEIWSTMVERKDLFNTDRMVIQKYTGDSPFTYYFGQDSPGRAAVYLGYRILEAYMENNPDLTLGDLMQEQDGHKVFRESRYRP